MNNHVITNALRQVFDQVEHGVEAVMNETEEAAWHMLVNEGVLDMVKKAMASQCDCTIAACIHGEIRGAVYEAFAKMQVDYDLGIPFKCLQCDQPTTIKAIRCGDCCAKDKQGVIV